MPFVRKYLLERIVSRFLKMLLFLCVEQADADITRNKQVDREFRIHKQYNLHL